MNNTIILFTGGTVAILITALMIKLTRFNTILVTQQACIETLKQDLQAMLSCEKGMGSRIKQQQNMVRTLAERQDKLEISDGSNTSYKQAMVLLQRGASTDDLIDACDMSRGELELLSRLQSITDPKTHYQAA